MMHGTLQNSCCIFGHVIPYHNTDSGIEVSYVRPKGSSESKE